MKKKKSKKKLLIGAGVIAVVAVGGVSVLGGRSSGEEAVPQVEVVKAEIGDVQQTVEASGTVVSEESKTYFSPVNAKVDKVDFKEGDTVKAGTELVAFDKKDLEREQKKADLNVESGKLDMTNTINKSDKAVQKQKDAAGNASSLKQQVAAQEDYVASLKAQISQVTANAQAQAAAESARKAAEAQAAQEAAQQKIQQEYAADLSTYQNKTLPAYQNKLNELNNTMNQTLQEYNQSERPGRGIRRTKMQMHFPLQNSYGVSHRLHIRTQSVTTKIIRHRSRKHRCYLITQEKVLQSCQMEPRQKHPLIFRILQKQRQ